MRLIIELCIKMLDVFQGSLPAGPFDEPQEITAFLINQENDHHEACSSLGDTADDGDAEHFVESLNGLDAIRENLQKDVTSKFIGIGRDRWASKIVGQGWQRLQAL